MADSVKVAKSASFLALYVWNMYKIQDNIHILAIPKCGVIRCGSFGSFIPIKELGYGAKPQISKQKYKFIFDKI